jgi:hypothetical protein
MTRLRRFSSTSSYSSPSSSPFPFPFPDSIVSSSGDGIAEHVSPSPLADEAWLSWTIKDFVYQTEAYKAMSEAARRWGWIAPMEAVPEESVADDASGPAH